MAGLVEKVKQSIRNRSRSRKSIGGSDYERDNRTSVEESRRSNQYQDGRRSGQYQDGRPSGQYHDGRPSGQYQDERVGRSPQAPSAWHVSQGAGSQVNKPLPADPATNGYAATDRGADVAATQTGSLSRKPVSNTTGEVAPVRSSSLRHGRHTSDTNGNVNAGRTGYESVPTMPSSYNTSHSYDQHAATNSHGTHHNMDAERNLDERMDGMNLGSSPGRNHQSVSSIGVSDSIRQRNGGTRDEIPPVPAIASNHQNSAGVTSQADTVGTTNRGNEHLRLPAGFNMNRTEKTEVTTQWKPAVTQETVFRERTEILQEEITRDIHIHHYYTYLQPVKVVEVLPAKHYSLDHMTGIKTEIPAPVGWLLPEDMQSRQPDTSMVTGLTRHYLVNEEHPNGIPEAPPLRHKEDRAHMQTNQGTEGYNQEHAYHNSTKPLGGRFAEEREFHHSTQPTGRAM